MVRQLEWQLLLHFLQTVISRHRLLPIIRQSFNARDSPGKLPSSRKYSSGLKKDTHKRPTSHPHLVLKLTHANKTVYLQMLQLQPTILKKKRMSGRVSPQKLKTFYHLQSTQPRYNTNTPSAHEAGHAHQSKLSSLDLPLTP